jgi:hypothetical protein
MQPRLVSFFCLLLTAQSLSAGIVLPIVTVGTNPAECDYTTIQAAIDDASSGDQIHVQAINYALPSGLTITNKSLTLIGGYSDCNDDTTDPNTPTTLTEAGVGTVVTVGSVIAGVQDVVLRNFTLRLGEGGANKGGGVDLSGPVNLTLINVEVQENEAMYGGGIRIQPGPPYSKLVLDGGSRIGGTGAFNGSNSATQHGGGIYCSGGGLIEWKNASINYNNAYNGGGIYLDNCDLTTPTFSGSELRLTEIRGNSAVNIGGGLTLVSGGTANLASRLNRLVQIVGNSAATDAGGISANGSSVSLAGVRIEQNSAGQNGGAAIIFDSQFSLSRGEADGSNCPQPPRCATMRRNVASINSGALRASNGAQVILNEVYLESNQSVGIAGILLTSGASAVLSNVQVAGNTATSPGSARVFFLNDATLDMRHVTMALNQVNFGIEVGGNSTLKAHDSILWQPGVPMLQVDGTETLDLSCNNSSDTVTVPGAAGHDPGFFTTAVVGQTQPLLYLAAGSQNTDRCDENPAPPLIDLLGGPRVYDLAGVADGDGPMDRGAFEYQPPIFEDGFED